MYYFHNNAYNFRIYPIKFNNPYKIYYLLLYENRDKYETLVNIVTFNHNFNMWQCVYCELLQNYIGVKFYNQKWDLTNKRVLVLYSQGIGSGGFMSYEVLGEEDGKIIKYVSEKDIFKGSIFFKGTKLIRGTSNQFRVWDKINDKFVLVPYKMPEYPGATVIRYSIVDENTVDIEKKNYILPVGSIVQFIREDFNDINERILFSSKPHCMKFIQISTFKITCKTKITATIIPGGYNWDGAVEVTIITE